MPKVFIAIYKLLRLCFPVLSLKRPDQTSGSLNMILKIFASTSLLMDTTAKYIY